MILVTYILLLSVDLLVVGCVGIMRPWSHDDMFGLGFGDVFLGGRGFHNEE